MSRRTRQLGEFLREELSDIIRREVDDPRVGFFSVTTVEVTDDLRSARVYISVLGTNEERAATLAALRSASSFIRHHLRPRLSTRHIPELEFRDDRSMEHADTIARAINALREADAAASASRAGDERNADGGDGNLEEARPLMATVAPAETWSLDPDAAADALRQLRSARSVLIPAHQNVDADGLSTPIALSLALREFGVNAIPMISDGQMPHSLGFLPYVDDVLIYGRDPLPDYDMLCLADCSDRKRLGAFYGDDPSRVDGSVPIVNIDHHVTNDRFGVVNIVEPDAASTAEIVTEIIRAWGVAITTPIAQCLLAGIYGDTLGLRTSSTTSRTMRTAADLVDAGANPEPIVDALFRVKPKSSVCLWEQALRNVQWTGSLIWTELTGELFDRCGAQPSEAEGLVNFLVGTEGSLVAAILYAIDDGWRVSLRSLPPHIDVAAIAAEFGGGGHPRAAGCTVHGGEVEKLRFVTRVAAMATEADRAAVAG